MVAIGEHYRPARDGGGPEQPAPPGVYRVVGTGDPVALLRVGDADGRRVTTGEVVRVDHVALDASFERADDPDAGIHPIRGLANAASGFYWQFRRFF